MFPSDLQCRRMLCCCVEAAGISGLWEGSLSCVCFTMLHRALRSMGWRLNLPAQLSRKADYLPLQVSLFSAGQVAKSRTFPRGTLETDTAVRYPRDVPQGWLWHQPSTGTTVKTKQLCAVHGASSC